MKFEEKYPQYKYLVDEGIIREIYYNDKESICQFGSSYVVFNYKLEDMCVYAEDLGDLVMLAYNPKLVIQFHKQKKISGFKMTPGIIEAARQYAANNPPYQNPEFEEDMKKLFEEQQAAIGNGKRGR